MSDTNAIKSRKALTRSKTVRDVAIWNAAIDSLKEELMQTFVKNINRNFMGIENEEQLTDDVFNIFYTSLDEACSTTVEKEEEAIDYV